MDSFIVSARKYRPATFDMVVGQDSITNTLKSAIRNRQLAQAYLFCGPRGVGKTTCARIFAKTINCFNLTPSGDPCNSCESCLSFNSLRSFNIHELDAASNNKVDDIRTLTDQVRIPPQIGKYSVYIIDEVHMLSSSAFNAFLKTLEEPPAHAIFILATTEKHKIIPTILSRCQIFDFKRIRVEDIVQRLVFVAEREAVTYEENALHVIALKADGAMRDALSIFDQMVSFCGKNITYNDVIENLNVLDYEFYFRTVEAALETDISKILLVFNEVLEKGFDGHNFITGLGSHLRDLLVCQDKSTVKLLEAAPSVRDRYLLQSSKCNVAFLYKTLDICSSCDIGYRNSKNQRLHVELALLKICSLTREADAGEQKKKPERVEAVTRETAIEKPSVQTPPANTQARPQPAPRPIPQQEKPLQNQDPVKQPVASVSLKEIIGSGNSTVEKKSEVKEIPEEKIIVPENRPPFSADAFTGVWNSFSQQMQADSPRAAGMFKSIKAVVEDGNKVVLHLTNADERDYFTRNYSHRLTNLLISEFSDPPQGIETVIDTVIQKTNLYSDDDKLDHLQEKFPAIKDFRKSFNLDLE